MDDTSKGASEALGERLKVAAETMKESSERMAESGSQLGLRLIAQAEANMHEAFAAMRAATQARDVAEVMRVQADFLRGQSSRSMEQAREIGELIVGMGRDTMDRMTRGE